MSSIRSKRLRDFTAILGLCGMLAVPYASAVITPIPTPVVGSLTETWESFPNYNTGPFNLTDPTSIMGGGALISNSNMVVYEPGVADFGLGDSGLAQVSDGAKGMGIDSSAETTTITFTTPVPNFGAFWGAATGASAGLPSTATVYVSFFDVSNLPIGTEQFTYVRPAGDGVLEWHGWASTVGIAQLTYTGDYVVNDGLQANAVVPEPGTLTLTGIGLLGLLGYGWQRRKRTA
jgi:hypothetical protein